MPPWPKTVLRILLILATGYLLIAFGLWLLQRKLIYFPDAASPPLPANAERDGLRTVQLPTADGLKLEAWWWSNEGAPALLLLHGNAGNRLGRLAWMEPFHRAGYQVLLLDYRGYGGSDGTPSEAGLYTDGDAALDWLAQKNVSSVSLIARSLGTGVAVDLASRRPVQAVILHAAYDSVASIAQAHYRWLPVELLLKDRFDSLAKVHKVSAPLLFIHGNRDNVIAWDAGHRLFKKAKQPKAWITVDGAGHNDLITSDPTSYYETVLSWLAEHAPIPRQDSNP